MQKEKFSFQAEVGKILDVVAHSLYSQSEIFLREYISNAADACDKLRYEAINKPDLLKSDTSFKINIILDTKDKSITIEDNGIGMSKDDLINSLGTIARSGTEDFMKKMSSDKEDKDNLSLIGKFGVGFYSGFMVAKQIEVLSKKAGNSESWSWSSDGKGEYSIAKAEKLTRGTKVILYLSDKAKEFNEKIRLENIIKKYSDHISQPVYLLDKNSKNKENKEELINSASAIWTRDKKDISKEQYKEFYNNIGMTYDDPWMTIHNKIEGAINYTNLIFIPSIRPPDIFTPEKKVSIKLYVKKVFITDNCEGLLPSYLRFVKGMIDSDDIALNVSREMLQHNPAIIKINNALVKRILTDLDKRSTKSFANYITFWENFGIVIKEGIHEDFKNKEKILSLSLFRSSHNNEWTKIDDYIKRVKKEQKNIFYISGDNKEQLIKSPQLETFIKNKIEVLFMTDPVDEFWLSSVPEYKQLKFKSITKGDIDITDIKSEDTKKEEENKEDGNNEEMENLIKFLKPYYGDKVKDVKKSSRLTESPVCLVAGETDMDIHLENLLKKHKQIDQTSTKILEINPYHKLIISLSKLKLEKKENRNKLENIAMILLDQAKIIEGLPVSDSKDFSDRLNNVVMENLNL